MTDDPLVPTGFRLSFTPQEPSSPANTINVKDPAQRDSRLTTFTYDNADRLLSQQRPGGKSVTYTLDTVSNLKTIKAEGAQPVSMALNNQGFLVTMFDGPTRVTFTYDANGNMTVENRGGIRTTFTYDRENRLTVKNDNRRSRESGRSQDNHDV